MHGSLKTLLDALLKALIELGVELINESPVKELNIENNQLSGVVTTQSVYEGGKFVFTIPTLYLKDMVKDKNIGK